MTAAKTTRKPKGNASPNGQPDPLAEAIAYEQAIAAEAEKVRGDEERLTPQLFLKLLPLLRRPIPAGFITTTEATKGKPYDSTGIRSIQVCIDRMDNVLTPLWWEEQVDYAEDGKLATVTVTVEVEGGSVVRRSAGGVNQGSTIGNIYKGSYTNAAKRAFAMLGVGHEVYLGAADYDPDVNPDAAKAQEKNGEGSGEKKLAPDRAEKLQALLDEAGVEKKHLDAKLRQFGVKKLTDLQVGQGIQLYEWAVEQGTGGGS